MSVKLAGFVLVLVILVAFAGFNLGNQCDISFGFVTFPKVPVFMSTLVAFLAGMIVTLPFTIRSRKGKKGPAGPAPVTGEAENGSASPAAGAPASAPVAAPAQADGPDAGSGKVPASGRKSAKKRGGKGSTPHD